MKVLKIDKRMNEIVVIPENTEDLWHLEKIIEKGDIINGKTDRKIKPKNDGEKSERITLFIELETEEAHFQEYSGNLRISGIILGGKPEEFIELKSHQSIDISAGEKIKIQKKEIKQWHIDRVKKAEKESSAAGMIVVLLDDEQADIASINQFAINKKAGIKSNKRGKRYSEEKSDYFEKITEKLEQIKPKKLLIAGPGFTKENLKKFYEEKKQKGMPTAMIETTSEINETGFKELISQGKLSALEKELQLTQEGKIIEEFLKELSKGRADYGKEKIIEDINIGAVEKVIVSETKLMQERKETEKIMDLAEKAGCEVHVISSKNPQEKEIHNFGGIVVILRYKIQ